MFTCPGLEAILLPTWPGSDMELVRVTDRIGTQPGFPGAPSVQENLRTLELPSLRMLGDDGTLQQRSYIWASHLNKHVSDRKLMSRHGALQWVR